MNIRTGIILLLDGNVLCDSYIRQKACVAWGVLDLSISYLKIKLSQGFLSAIIFTIYINKLLVIFTTSGIWCHIGSASIGAISYADDITLLCPGIIIIIVYHIRRRRLLCAQNFVQTSLFFAKFISSNGDFPTILLR